MAVDVRWSTGLDTCLLQAADSFWRLMAFRAGRGAEGSYGAPDPAARQQFIEAVDIYCDSPAIRLVLPIHQMGHLGRIGKLVAGEATPLVGAIETCRFRDDRGTELYRHFISLIRSNSGFRERAIAWAWFQFLDPDVLLGYAGRMGVAKDVKFLKDNMRLEFATALRHLQGSEVHSAVRSAKEQSTALHHSPNELSALITRLRGEDIEDLQQAGELAD